MKKGLSLVLCAVLCLLPLGGCGDIGPSQASPGITIGISVYDQHDTFVGVMYEHLQRLAREKEAVDGVTISFLYGNADNSQITQNSQVEGFIRDGCDVICVNLVERMDASVVIDRAEAAGIPVLFFNRELVEEDLERWDKLYYVGATALDSGRMQGDIVADLCRRDFDSVDRNADGVIQYVMLEGEAGHQDAVYRTEYSVGVLQEAGFLVERLEDEIANWYADQAEKKMTTWLENHGSAIEVVFSNNDEMALGAIAALNKATEEGHLERQDWPVVVGIDGTPAGLQAVVDGEMSGTVYNDAQGQALALLELSLFLTQGTALPQDMVLIDGKYIRLPYQKVTLENVDNFLDLH